MFKAHNADRGCMEAHPTAVCLQNIRARGLSAPSAIKCAADHWLRGTHDVQLCLVQRSTARADDDRKQPASCSCCGGGACPPARCRRPPRGPGSSTPRCPTPAGLPPPVAWHCDRPFCRLLCCCRHCHRLPLRRRRCCRRDAAPPAAPLKWMTSRHPPDVMQCSGAVGCQ